MKKTKRMGLPRRPGHRREAHAGLACFHYQKLIIVRNARLRGWSVSRYLSFLIDSDWLEPAAPPKPKGKRRKK